MAKLLRSVTDPMGPPPPDRMVPKPGGPVDRRRYSSVPPIWISGADRVPDIESALYSLQVGNFRQAALVADAAMRDDRIWSVMDTRLGVIRGADVEVKPADDSAEAEKVATVLGGDETKTGIWEDLFPSSVIADLLQYGWLNSIAVAQIVWLPTTDSDGAKMWLPRLVPVHPQFIYWDWGYNCYRLILAEETISLPDVSANPYSDGKWFIWCPFGYQYAWRKAMIKPLADLYLRRRWNCRDWARYNEKHGSPADIVYVPEDAEQDDKEAYFMDVVNRGSDTAVMVPRRDGQSKDSGYGLEMLEAKARTYDSFNLSQEKIDNSVAILFWGQNLTTEVTEGKGSLGVKGQQKVADIKTKEDAAIARALCQQVLPWWAHHNYGKWELAPRVRYATEPPTDIKDEGAGLKAIGDGAQALKTANPRTDVDAIYDAHNIPMLTDEQMAEEQRQAMERAQEMAAATGVKPGGGDDDPDGGGGPPGGSKGGQPGKPAGGAAGAAAKGGDGKAGGAGGGEDDDEENEKKPSKKEKAARLKNTGAQVVALREYAGFLIAIENAAGTTRRWFDPDGNETGSTLMRCDYGYFVDHLGADGEELDVYLGPDPTAPDVHIVTQLKAPDYRAKDEQKVMLGFPDQASAKAAYMAHRNDGERAIGGILTISLTRFRKKLRLRRGGGHISARASRSGTATLSVRTVVAKRRPKKLYSDAVAASGHRLAVKAMATSLHRVVAAIKAAHSYEDLKKRLAHEFRAMRPAELAEVVRRARIMAKAGGMDTAWQQA